MYMKRVIILASGAGSNAENIIMGAFTGTITVDGAASKNVAMAGVAGGATINAIGYNSAVIGASDYYSDETKALSQAIYPGDTASKLNPWPPEPVWYADARAEYANKFETA